MTSRKQLVACPKNYLAANNEAEEDFNKNVACAVQTITTQEDGFLSQDQRNMLVLNAMLIGAPVDHGHQPILVSLSTLYVDAKQIKNGMDNKDKASTTEESQAIEYEGGSFQDHPDRSPCRIGFGLMLPISTSPRSSWFGFIDVSMVLNVASIRSA